MPVARAPHPGPTGFPWRRLREVRRGWWGRCCPLPLDLAHISATSSISSHTFTPCGLQLLPVQSPLLSIALASLLDLFPILPLLGGLHELPMRMLFAPCLHFLGSGRSQEEVGVPASPLPCPPVPLGPPKNVTAIRNGSQAIVRWQKPMAPLQGTLLGYRLAYRGQDTPEVGAAGWGRAEELRRREMGRRR